MTSTLIARFSLLLWSLGWCLNTIQVRAQIPATDQVLETAQADVAVLVSDSLKGRGYLFDGHTKAAAYLQQRFAGIGLQPVDSTYVQPFLLETDLFPGAARLAVNGRALPLGTVFLPHPSSGSGLAGEERRVVRAGSGVVVPEQNLNVYAGRDVKGAVVVLEASVPDTLRANATVPPMLLTQEARIRSAAQHGARAVIFLEEALVFGGSSYDAPIPVFEVLQSAWPERADGVSYHVESRRDTTILAQNVLGVVPGRVRPDSFIVVAAHYDHLGAIGERLYFPGANDNASGTAMLLSLAQYFAEHPLPYSLLFVAFSGEEIGLLGSRYFVEHSPIDLSRVTLMLNFDMVASGTRGIMAVGGADFPAVFDMLAEVNRAVGAEPLGKRANAPISDHYWFAAQGIPTLYLYTNRGAQPYHHVNDRPETLEWDDYLYVYELAREFLERMAS